MSAIEMEPSDSELIHLIPNMPAAIVRKLTATRRVVVYEPGEVVFRAGARGDPGLVIDGLMRHSVRWGNGRQATLSHIRRGSLVGMVCLFGPVPFTMSALDRSTVVHFDLEELRTLAGKHPSVALAVAQIQSSLAIEMANSAAKFAFMNVEERVADYLLAVASPAGAGHGRVARVTQRQIADAVGSAREVVARVLRMLRIEGWIEEGRGVVTICDPEALLNCSAKHQQRISDPIRPHRLS